VLDGYLYQYRERTKVTGLDGFPRVLQFTPGPPVFPGSSSLLRVLQFSPGPPVSSNNKTDHHDIAEILLKVTLNITNQPNQANCYLVETFKAAVSSIKCWFMEPVNSVWPSSIVMCNLWHNIQLVEGGQYLVEVEQPLP
jgi:hypothetical protein